MQQSENPTVGVYREPLPLLIIIMSMFSLKRENQKTP